MIPLKGSSIRNISAGAIKLFNESNICDKVPSNMNIMLDSIYNIVDKRLYMNTNNIYASFWKNLRTEHKKGQRRFSKKQMKEFVDLCWSTYKKIQIKQKLNEINKDF